MQGTQIRAAIRHPSLVAVLFCCLIVPVPAWAQSVSDSSEPQLGLPDNFSHPPGTKTMKLGTLGHTEKIGRGPVDLILIPGASFDWTVWKSFADRNVERYTMYAVTPPGYGGTPPPPMPDPADRFEERTWTEAMLGAVVDLIDRNEMSKPIVVGHHLMGDYYVMRLALEHPQLISGAVIIAGDPVRPLTSNGTQSVDRVKLVHEDPTQAPFYKTVDFETWKANTYPPGDLCTDSERGQELFEQEIGTPISTQIRYYLEYLTDDAAARLGNLKVPLLVVNPARPGASFDGTEAGFDALLEANLERNMGHLEGLSRDDAKQALRENILQQFGSIEAFGVFLRERSRPWDSIAQANSRVRLEEIEDTRIFIMEDQPARLDEIISEFATTLE